MLLASRRGNVLKIYLSKRLLQHFWTFRFPAIWGLQLPQWIFRSPIPGRFLSQDASTWANMKKINQNQLITICHTTHPKQVTFSWNFFRGVSKLAVSALDNQPLKLSKIQETQKALLQVQSNSSFLKHRLRQAWKDLIDLRCVVVLGCINIKKCICLHLILWGLFLLQCC